MRIKSPSGRVFVLPTPKEESAIRAGVTEDPDTYELTDAEFRQLKRVGRPPQRPRHRTAKPRCRPRGKPSC